MKLVFSEERTFDANDIDKITVSRYAIDIYTNDGEGYGYEITTENLTSVKQFFASITQNKKTKKAK